MAGGAAREGHDEAWGIEELGSRGDSSGPGGEAARSPEGSGRRRGPVAIKALAGALIAFGGLVLLGPASTGSEDSPPPGQGASQAQPAQSTLPPPAPSGAPGRIFDASQDVSDPFLLSDGGRLYLYSTESLSGHVNVPTEEAGVFGQWGATTDALPVLPPWATPGQTWSPDVRHLGGNYVLYFTAALLGIDSRCIGDAISQSPTGPFIPSPAPLVCQLERGGSIDPRTFVDKSGNLWLYWKSDENSRTPQVAPATIWAQRLSPDGLQLLGAEIPVFSADEPWQNGIIEAPQMVLQGDSYWLWYSGNAANNPGYGISVAACAGPAGPCKELRADPLLGANAQGVGPGEESLYQSGGRTWLLYNPWAVSAPYVFVRPLAIAAVAVSPFGPYLSRLESLPTVQAGQ